MKYANIEVWDSLLELKAFLAGGDVEIIGVEISTTSHPLSTISFENRRVSFMFGNEGEGMTEKQISVCNELIHIEQFSGVIESLNVSVAASIVFYKWARKFKYKLIIS